MINSRKELLETLSYERNLYGGGSVKLFGPALSEQKIAWKFVCLLRYEEYHYNVRHKIRANFYRFLRIRLSRKYSLFIPINIVERGIMIHHPHNITINAKRVGQNFSIQFNTALIAGGHDGGCPTIGNDVAIGVGAVLLGDIHIADGIAVGANSLVNKSFEERNIAVAGNPAKKISNNGSSTWGGVKRMHELLAKGK